MTMIKDMNTDIQRTALEEKAAAGDTMAQAELTAMELGLVNEAAKFNVQQVSDMKKLAKQYVKGGTEGDEKVDFVDEELNEMIGNDLEMLEYSTEAIEEMIPAIIRMIKKQR